MLDRVTIERMLAWTGDRPVLVALSGGGDSVSLLHLLAKEFGAAQLRAVIVDHALRAGSDSDANRARGFAAELGVGAEVLTLKWEGRANRAQQAAREARYRAICDYARAHDLNTIAAAHTADDQAETVLMRAANGSTWRGLAGIAPFAFAPLWPDGRGVALARPLLAARREELRDYLRDQRADWIDDPANSNPKFERVRVRHRLAELEKGGFEPSRLVRLATRLRKRSTALDVAAAALISRAANIDFAPTIHRASWDGPDEVRWRALSALIAAAAGTSREPPWTELPRLEAKVMNTAYRGSTHSGVDFTAHLDRVALSRGLGAAIGRADGVPPQAPLHLQANVEAIWDGRLAVTAPEPGWRIVPARNGHRLAFENSLGRASYEEVAERFRLRPLAADRIAHAFAPDINRAKP